MTPDFADSMAIYAVALALLLALILTSELVVNAICALGRRMGWW
jgi:hypothetical protein